MSIEALTSYTLGFGSVLVIGLVYAAVRRSVPVAVAALFWGAPAPFFGHLFARYEASLPPGTNIRVDWPIMWGLLSIGAAFSVGLAVFLLSHWLMSVGGKLKRRRDPRGPLRSRQDPSNPRGAAGRG